jgi:hypothetical protein
VVVSLIGGAACAAGVVVAIATESPLPLVPFSLVGAILFFLGMWNLSRLGRAARAVALYEGGFTALRGSNPIVLPWAAIASIVSDLKMVSGQRIAWTEYRYEVRARDGTTVELTNDYFEDLDGIVSAIKGHVWMLLRPGAQAAYDAGQPLAFGPVTVSREGVVAGGLALAWSAVQDVGVKRGRLVVTPKGGSPLQVRASTIPNIELLGMLIGVDPTGMDLAYF